MKTLKFAFEINWPLDLEKKSLLLPFSNSRIPFETWLMIICDSSKCWMHILWGFLPLPSHKMFDIPTYLPQIFNFWESKVMKSLAWTWFFIHLKIRENVHLMYRWCTGIKIYLSWTFRLPIKIFHCKKEYSSRWKKLFLIRAKLWR